MLYLLYFIIGIVISGLAIFKSREIIDNTSFAGFVVVFIMGIILASTGVIGLGVIASGGQL